MSNIIIWRMFALIDVSKLSGVELKELEDSLFDGSMNRHMREVMIEGRKELVNHIAWRDHYFNEFNEWNVIGINPSTCPHPEDMIESIGGITARCTRCKEYFDDIDEGQNICGTK